MSFIALENVGKTFVTGRRFRHLLNPWAKDTLRQVVALQEVSLKIEEGEFFGLMGPNGSGKTTLLKILATLILPDRGKIRVNGYDLRSEQGIKRSLGLVTGGERSFYWRLTGKQNLEFFASLYGLSSGEAGRRILQLCERLQIENPERPFQEYSSGLKQRFLLARALLHDPPILLLDEPTRSLDRGSAEKFRGLLLELVRSQRKTVIYATHQVEDTSLFNRIGLLREGALVKLGKWTEVSQEYLC